MRLFDDNIKMLLITGDDFDDDVDVDDEKHFGASFSKLNSKYVMG